MAQFTAPGLARLLANVEREVLVEALDLAGMTQLLTSDALGTLEDLQFRLNQLQNLETFGPAWLKMQAGNLIDVKLEGLPIYVQIPWNLWKNTYRLWITIFDKIGELGGEEDTDDIPDFVSDFVLNMANRMDLPLNKMSDHLEEHAHHPVFSSRIQQLREMLRELRGFITSDVV